MNDETTHQKYLNQIVCGWCQARFSDPADCSLHIQVKHTGQLVPMPAKLADELTALMKRFQETPTFYKVADTYEQGLPKSKILELIDKACDSAAPLTNLRKWIKAQK